jgi:DoxX
MAKGPEPALIFPALRGVYDGLAAWVLPLLRFIAGFSMAMQGFVHIRADMAQTAAYFASEGYEPGLFWAWAVTLTELVGGVCLAIGFLTRLVAVPIFSVSGHGGFLPFEERLLLGPRRFRIPADVGGGRSRVPDQRRRQRLDRPAPGKELLAPPRHLRQFKAFALKTCRTDSYRPSPDHG